MNAGRVVRIGTRGSGLALVQTQEVLAALRKLYASRTFQSITLKTQGDVQSRASLVSLGRGAFVRELEVALLDKAIDIAVHSLKDLPTEQPDGLVVGAVFRRHDPRDVLIDRWKLPLDRLPAGARIGTSSTRRAALLLQARPDVRALPIRGNVDTRVRKALGEEYDGAILAAAGLERLGLLEHVAQYLPPEQFIPDPGQGALAIEVRANDAEMQALVRGLDHPETRAAVSAERALLAAFGGGCRAPIAAFGRVAGRRLSLLAMVATPDGKRVLRTEVEGPAADPGALARGAQAALIAQGAREIVAEFSQ